MTSLIDEVDNTPDLLTEVGLFQEWSNAYSPDERSSEWECDYPSWPNLYTALFIFVTIYPFQSWSSVEVHAVLFTLARDNESGYIASELRSRFPELLLPLTQASVASGEPQACWQLAEELSWLDPEGGEAEQLLLILARDENEYVRRRSLRALARLGASVVEELALEAWERPDPSQEWARMMVLSCLHQVGSPKLEPLLAVAEKEERQYLREYAQKIRRGEVSTH